MKKLRRLLLVCKRFLVENNFFLELQDHGIEEQKTCKPGLIRMSQETGITLVVTNDVHYTYEDDVDSS